MLIYILTAITTQNQLRVSTPQFICIEGCSGGGGGSVRWNGTLTKSHHQPVQIGFERYLISPYSLVGLYNLNFYLIFIYQTIFYD
jgi:hypothetical protein